jgi:putative oxidoreductase
MTWLDIGLLLIRLSLGTTLIVHGWNHWRGGGRIAGTANWFESVGLRPGIAHAWASVVTEETPGKSRYLGGVLREQAHIPETLNIKPRRHGPSIIAER